MAREIIATGTSANDGSGDTLRAGAEKINNNFSELYNTVANLGVLVSDSAGGLNLEGLAFDQRSVVFFGVESANSAVADNNETFLRAIEPTKDNIILLPDSSGTLAFREDFAVNKNILDSAEILQMIGVGVDSAAVNELIKVGSIDSVGVIEMINTDYILARVTIGFDSALANQEADEYLTKSYLNLKMGIDSNFILNAHDVDSDLGAIQQSINPYPGRTPDLGSNTTRFRDLNLSRNIHLDSARFNFNDTNNELTFFNVYSVRTKDSNNGTSTYLLDSASAISVIDSAYIQFRTNEEYVSGLFAKGNTHMDSAFVTGFIDSDVFMSMTELKTEVAASADFAAFKTRIGNL